MTTMTAENFCYWLQGWFELSKTNGGVTMNDAAAKMIEDHLKLVFEKVTPNYEYHKPSLLNTSLRDAVGPSISDRIMC